MGETPSLILGVAEEVSLRTQLQPNKGGRKLMLKHC